MATSGPAADSATLQIVATQPTYDSYDGTWYFTVPEPNMDPPVRNWHPSHKLVIDGWYGYEAEYVSELGEWVTSAPTLQTVDRWNGYLYLFVPGRRIRFYGPWTETSIQGTYTYYIQYQEYTVNVTYTRAPTA